MAGRKVEGWPAPPPLLPPPPKVLGGRKPAVRCIGEMGVELRRHDFKLARSFRHQTSRAGGGHSPVMKDPPLASEVAAIMVEAP
jgi:hypothetical protein